MVELRARAGERIVSELLPVLDDLDRVLDHAIQSSEAGVELEQLIKGVEMVRDRILTVFGKEGVEVVPKLPGSLYTGNNFPACKIGFTNEEIAAQSGENN